MVWQRFFMAHLSVKEIKKKKKKKGENGKK